MLTTEDVRQRLNDPTLTEDRLAEIRDTLNAFARLAVEAYLQQHLHQKR